MAEKKKTKGWSLAEMQDTLVKDTEEKIEQGFREIAKEQSEGQTDGGTGQPPAVPTGGEQSSSPAVQPVREITAPAIQPLTSTKNSQQQGQASIYQEPTQNINIPIPTSQHTRLKIISAQTRQPMKDMVVQAIGLWLDVQEGKKGVKS